MFSENSPKSNETQLSNSNKVVYIKDVDFPGDEKGNQLASIEAQIKVNAEFNLLNKEIINDLILTTADKLKNQLNDYRNILAGKTDWIGPLGMVITLLATLVASDFKDALSIKASTWEAIFIIFFIGSIIWFIIVICKVIRYRNKRDISSLIQKIKKRE